MTRCKEGGDPYISRGTFHFHSFQASFFLETQNPVGQQLVLEKKDGCKTNGESTPRTLRGDLEAFVSSWDPFPVPWKPGDLFSSLGTCGGLELDLKH